MPPDVELLTTVVADFEAGKDLDDRNPFDVDHSESYAHVVQAFVSGCTVPDIKKINDAFGVTGNNELTATAMAAFFQGLAIGYDYAAREWST